MSSEDLAKLIEQSSPHELPAGCAHSENVNEAHRLLASKFLAAFSDEPDKYQGKGIVIAGGGTKYFPGAWVCVNVLRRLAWMMSLP